MGECNIEAPLELSSSSENLNSTRVFQMIPDLKDRIAETNVEISRIENHLSNMNTQISTSSVDSKIAEQELVADLFELEAMARNYKRDFESLFSRAQCMALESEQSFDEYKVLTLNQILSLIPIRGIRLGYTSGNYSSPYLKFHIDAMIAILKPYTDVFGISQEELITAFSQEEGLNNLSERIQGIEFEENVGE